MVSGGPRPGAPEGASLYSVRLRAARGGPHERGGEHVAGAERIVTGREVLATVRSLLRRAQGSALGEPDFLQVSIERLAAQPQRIPFLPVVTLTTAAPDEARSAARALLASAGVAPAVAETAVALLAAGPGPGGRNMRGAALMDAVSGRRLEPDPARGVRAARLDVAPEARRALAARLRRAGLTGRRVAEALVLASKVIWAGAVAELCWSDDPDYTTGYVAARRLGYVRLLHAKPPGVPRGGRVFFVPPGADVAGLVRRLEEEPVLVAGPLQVRPAVAPGPFLEGVANGPAAATT